MKRPAALAAVLLAASPALAREPSPGAVRKTVERITGRPAFASATWAVEVRSLASGRVLYAQGAGKSMQPASTLKLVPTAAALDAFGPGHRIRTTVETAGRLDGLGRVLGDVYLVGRGDPNLSGRFSEGRITAAFEQMADQLVEAGVRRIEGRLVGHEGLFPGERRGDDWSWGDLVWWYGAEVSALSFNDNCADLRVAPGERVGDPIVVEWQPRSSYFTVASTATTAPAGAPRELRVERAPGTSLIRFSGTLPLGSAPDDMAVALEDPARYAATVFGEVLASRGIVVSGPVETSSAVLPEGLRVLAAHEGAPMAEMIAAVNKPSQNLHAEMLLRLVGARAGAGTAEAGHEAALAFLRARGVATADWDLQDGSGLSRSDLVTARGLVDLLAAMHRHPHAAVFRASLAAPGLEGTLRSRMKGTAAEGRVAAKTGSIRHVNALAGYVRTAGGADLAFAILVNHHTAGGSAAIAAIDEIVVALAGAR